MNREEIIDMLESIGVTPMAMGPTSFKVYFEVFQKFTALVAAKEREACAQLSDDMGGIAACSQAIRARGQQ